MKSGDKEHKDNLIKGKYYTNNGKREKFLGYSEDGSRNWQPSPVKLSKMGKVKTQNKTNYKSTGSKKGKPRKKPLIDY